MLASNLSKPPPLEGRPIQASGFRLEVGNAGGLSLTQRAPESEEHPYRSAQP